MKEEIIGLLIELFASVIIIYVIYLASNFVYSLILAQPLLAILIIVSFIFLIKAASDEK